MRGVERMRAVWNFKRGKLAKDESGYILIMSLFVLIIVSLVGISLAIVGINEYQLTARTKIMDQAYAIAEAGVNRAAVQVRIQPDLTRTIGTFYPNNPPQWGPHTENFGGGSYTVNLWQSELVTTNANYKVVRSTGTITSAGRTAERTIETRIIVGTGGDEYDASFDYTIYNGFNQESYNGTWPDVDYWVGRFSWDGYNSYNGHWPKGAIYARGNINLPVRLAADLDILGNVVATNDITLYNAWEIQAIDPGIEIKKGNVVAGLDGTGSATVQTRWTGSLFQECIQVLADGVGGKGYVVAGTDVNVSSTANAGFDNPIVIGGIKAGRNCTIDGTVNISENLQIGPIISGTKTTIKSHWLTGITVGSIWSGPDPSVGGIGVDLESVAASSINTGAITSRGEVYAVATWASITIGNMTIGNNIAGATAGGTGLDYLAQGPSTASAGAVDSVGAINFRGQNWPALCNISVGNIRCNQNVDVGLFAWYLDLSGWGSVSVGSVASGGDVDIKLRQDWPLVPENLSVGNVSATGNVSIQGNDTVSVGSISANGNVGVCESLAFWGSSCRFTVGNVYSGGDDSGGYVREYLGGAGTIPWRASPGPGNPDPNDDEYPGDALPPFGGNFNVDLTYATGCNVYLLSHAEFTGADDSFTVGEIKSRGKVWGFAHDEFTTGGIQANSDLRIESRIKDITPGDDIHINGQCLSRTSVYLRSGATPGTGDSNVTGGIWSGGSVEVRRDDFVDVTDTDMHIGQIGGGDSVKARAGITLQGVGDTCIIFIGCWRPDIWLDGSGTARNPAGQTKSRTDTVGGCPNDGVFGYWNSGGYWDFWRDGDPGNPALYGGPGVTSPNLSKPAAPVVGRGGDVDVLAEAGLDDPVVLLEPNWAYFEESAALDDVANPSVPHMIYDTGNPLDGDWDGAAGNGEILFKWDSSVTNTPYSSNETVYNGDAGVNVLLDLNWTQEGSNFEGTIVSKGSVLIDDTMVAWFLGSTQVLNVVAGVDIAKHTGGLTLWQTNSAHYHLWAYRNIDLSNLRFALGGTNIWYGSFTAGNRVKYNSNTLVEFTAFKWSRWALDPVAWVPPFEVLSWKEL